MESASNTFANLALSQPVLTALSEIGYERPSPIQAASIPHLLNGEDLLGQAQTGTGKTAAFALPLLSKLDLQQKQPQILVLTPTRELAIQVAEAFQVYARHLAGFHVLPVYGGQNISAQLRQLKRGAHVIIGTPGRIMDHLRRKTLKLDELKALVLDEADEMLNMGFQEDVEWILTHTPEGRQTALFSATMPAPIRKIAQRYLHKPQEVKIQSKTATVAAIEQGFWQVNGVHKLDALTRFLEVEEFDGVLVFVRTKNDTTVLAEKLEARGYSAAPLHGDMNQSQRERTVDRLKNKKLDIVVATDVAARGLDVERITHVVNYDIPYDTQAYVHRIGGTGRAGRRGKAILFVAPREMNMLRSIERAINHPIERMQLPSRQSVTQKRIESFKRQISDVLGQQELGFFEEMLEQYQLEEGVESGKLAAALAYLLQKDQPLQPAALPETSVEQTRQKKAAGNRDKKRKDLPVAAIAKTPGKKPAEKKPAGKKPQRSNGAKDQDLDMESYRIEVGKQQGVAAADIVGAIANEAGLDSRYIGYIKLNDDHSLVDLPTGMPKDIFRHLKKVRIRQFPLNISLAHAHVHADARAKKAKSKKSKNKRQ